MARTCVHGRGILPRVCERMLGVVGCAEGDDEAMEATGKLRRFMSSTRLFECSNESSCNSNLQQHGRREKREGILIHRLHHCAKH